MNDTVKRGASAQLLSQFPQFRDLDPAALQTLAQRSTVESVPAGRLLFKPGLGGHQRLFLVSGEVALHSDQGSVDHVSAGSRAAEQELGSERPRQLWGWSKTRVEVLWVETPSEPDIESPAPQPRDGAAPSATPETQSPREPQIAALQQALQVAETKRTRAETEVVTLRARVAQLEQALQHARTRHEPARVQQAAPAAVPVPTTAAHGDASHLVAYAPSEAETAVPSLSLAAGARGAVTADEIDDLVKAWATNAGQADGRRL